VKRLLVVGVLLRVRVRAVDRAVVRRSGIATTSPNWCRIHAFITNNFVRGAVSGLGVINLLSGISELVAILLARKTDYRTRTAAGPPRLIARLVLSFV
jgi:hypothetical protein